jgi:hypothetical protein
VGDGLVQQPPGHLEVGGPEDRADGRADQLLEVLGQWPRASRKKCTVQRCHGAPSTWAMACLRPWWASEMTNWTLKAAADQAAQELPPERLGLGRAHLQADDLPLPAGVDPVGDHQSMVLDPPAGPDLLHLGVQPQIRVGARQGPLPEHGDLLIQALAEPRNGVLGHPSQPQASTSRSTLGVDTPLT